LSVVNAAENTWYSKDITGLVRQAWNNGTGTFYGIRIMSSDEADANERMDFWSTEQGSSQDAYIVVDYSTNTKPNQPTNLLPSGNTMVETLTPKFTGTFSDPDASEIMKSFQILLYSDSDVQIWDSGEILGNASDFTNSGLTYNGPSLTGNTFYKFTARTRDDGDLWGDYQVTKSRFKVNSKPNAPTIGLSGSNPADVQTLTPVFSVTHSDPDASDSLMYGYRMYVWNADWTEKWDTGYVSVSSAPAATKLITYAGTALSWNTTYYWSAYTYDSNGSTYGNWGSYPSFVTHRAGTPIALDPTASEVCALDGSGNPKPTFTGSRASSADSLTSVYIKVFLSTDLVSPVWVYGPSATGVSATGFSVPYTTPALQYGATYQWQAQVVSSIGGTSDWSALQTFATPASGSISMTAPVSPVADTTPDFTFNRTTAFTHWNIVVYKPTNNYADVAWDSGTQAGAGPRTVTYGTGGTVNLATLAFNTTYKWKVRVSADGGSTWGSGFTGLVAFNMDSAGVPTLNRPAASAWLGTPIVVDNFDSITGITNGANLTATAEGTTYQKGRGSVKYTGTFSGTQQAYRTLTTALDLSDYGNQIPIKIRAYISSLTSVTYLRVRFASTGSASTNYAEYTITPTGAGAWEQKTVTKGSPSATSGTINWADIKYIGIVASYAASVGPTIYIDDLIFDATAPSFDGTTSGVETISTFNIKVYSDAAGTNLVRDMGNVAGSGTTFSRLYDGTALTLGNTYYWQASYVKTSGAPGGFSALIPFTLNSAPIAPSALSPASGTVIADSLVPVFASTFSDNQKASRADFPVAYEVEVIRNSDSASVFNLFKDTGLNGGTNSTYDGDSGVLKRTGAASPIVYEETYSYRVRYHDSKGAEGTWSNYTIFKPSQSPTASVIQPANAGTLTSPAVNVSWSHSSPGSKSQNSYRLYVWNAELSSLVYDSGRVYASATTYAFPAGSLVNNTDYEFRVMTWDTDGLASAWDTNTVSTFWSGPAPISEFLVSSDEDNSRIKLEWSQSAIVDFRKYVIYRKRSIDSNWVVIAEIPSISTTEHSDYIVAYDTLYDYKITQMKIVVGDADLESGDSDLGTESLENDAWYVIGADRAPTHIFELPVIAGPFIEPVQQEVFEPLGTSRKVIIRGKVMGAEGTLNCKWPSDQRNEASAQIAYIKSNQGPHILKSPFGDLWQVEFSGPAKDYEIGGHFNVSLTWTEVA
jgi:hypothetical protein